jgi:hypothetical protein
MAAEEAEVPEALAAEAGEVEVMAEVMAVAEEAVVVAAIGSPR